MEIRLFSPENIKPEDYRHRYPELDRTSEFADLSPRALVFVWYYANQTSPIIDIRDDYERVEEALKKSGYNPGKVEKEAILKLQFNTDMAAAVKKMSEYNPSERFKAYKMIKTIFDHYEKLIQDGPEAFMVTEGKGENQISYIDHSRYVNTSAKIAEEIPILLVKLEEGFGVIDIKGGEMKEEEEITSIRDWHKKREHVNE